MPCWLEYTFIRLDGLTGWPVSVQLYLLLKEALPSNIVDCFQWLKNYWHLGYFNILCSTVQCLFFPHDFVFLYIFLVIFVPTMRQSFFVRFKLCTSGNTNLSTKQQWGISSDHLPGRSVFYSDYLPASHRGRRIQPANAVLLTLIRSKPAPASHESNIVREIQWRGVGWRNWSVTEGWKRNRDWWPPGQVGGRGETKTFQLGSWLLLKRDVEADTSAPANRTLRRRWGCHRWLSKTLTQPVSRVGVVVVETGPGAFSGANGGLEGRRWLNMGKLQVIQWRCRLDIDAGVVL